MFKLLPLVGFFGAFFSPLGLVGYLFAIKFFKVKFGLFDALFLLYIITILFCNFLLVGAFLSLSTFRFYFGFYVFYIFFKSGVDLPIKKIIYFLLLFIPLEALLINSVISPHIMPNFPAPEAFSHFSSGGYQRPYSFGGNASVSSSILVIMLSVLSVSRAVKLGVVGCIMLFSSGSGYLSLIFMYLLKYAKYVVIFSLFLIFLLINYRISIINYVDSFGIKLNSRYIIFLIDFKINQTLSMFDDFSLLDILFGKLKVLGDGYGGDFGWLYFVLGYGIISFFTLITFVLSKATKSTLIPLLIALLATFHYPVIFFLPGQIVLGYLMAGKYKKFTY